MLKIKQTILFCLILFGILNAKIFKDVTVSGKDHKGEPLVIRNAALAYTQDGNLKFVGIDTYKKIITGSATLSSNEVKVGSTNVRMPGTGAQSCVEKIHSNGEITTYARSNYIYTYKFDSDEHITLGRAHNNVNELENNVAVYGDDRIILTNPEDQKVLGIEFRASMLDESSSLLYGIEKVLGTSGDKRHFAISGLQDGLAVVSLNYGFQKFYSGNYHLTGGLGIRLIESNDRLIFIKEDEDKVKYDFVDNQKSALINPFHISYMGSGGYYQDSFIVIQKANRDVYLIRDFGNNSTAGENTVYKIPFKAKSVRVGLCGELTFIKLDDSIVFADASDIWSSLKQKDKINIDFYKSRTLLLDEKINTTLNLISEVESTSRNLGQEKLLQRLYQDYFACLSGLFHKINAESLDSNQIAQALTILEKASDVFDGVLAQVNRGLFWIDESDRLLNDAMGQVASEKCFEKIYQIVRKANSYKNTYLESLELINDCVQIGNDLTLFLDKHLKINSNLDAAHVSKMTDLKNSIITKLINPNVIVQTVTESLDDLKKNAYANENGTALMQVIDSRLKNLAGSPDNKEMWNGLILDLNKYSTFYGDLIWDYQRILCNTLIKYRKSENLDQWKNYLNTEYVQDFNLIDDVVRVFNESFSSLETLILNIEQEVKDNFDSDQKDLKAKLERVEKRNSFRTIQQNLIIKSNQGILDLLSKANVFSRTLKDISRLKEVFPSLNMSQLEINVNDKIKNLESVRETISQTQAKMKQQMISDQNQVRENLNAMVSHLGISSPENLTVNEIIIAMMDRMYVMIEAAKRESEKIQAEALARAEKLAQDLATAKANAAANLEATELAAEEKTKELTGTINSLEQQMKANDAALRASLAKADINRQELQTLLNERTSMVEKLEAQEKELKGYVDDMLKGLESTELAENESILEGFRRIVELKDKLILQLKNDLENAEKEAKELSNNLKETTDKLNAAIVQKNTLEKQNEELITQNNELELSKQESIKKISEMETSITNLEQDLKDAEQTEKDLGRRLNLSEEEKKAAEEKVEILSEDKEKLLQEKEAWEIERKNKDEKIKENQAKIDLQTRTLNEIRQELKTTKQNKSDLKKERDKLKADIAKLEKENQTNNDEIEKLNNKITEKDRQISSLETQLQEEKNKVTDLTADKKRLETDLEQMKKELANEKQKVEDYELIIEGNEIRITNLKNQLNDAKTLNEQLTTDLKAAREKNDEHLQTIETLKTTHAQEIEKLKAEKNARIQELEGIENQVRNRLEQEVGKDALTKDTITILNMVLSQKDQAYQDLETQKQIEVDDLKREMEELKDDLTGQLDQVKGDLEAKITELEETKKNRDIALKEKQDLIDQLEGESAKAQNLLKELLAKNVEGMSKAEFAQEEMSLSDKIAALENLRIHQIGEIKRKYEAQAILMNDEIINVKEEKKRLQDSLNTQRDLNTAQAAEIQKKIEELSRKESEYQLNLQNKETQITTLKSDFEQAKQSLEKQLSQAQTRNQNLETEIKNLNEQLQNKDLEIEAKEKLNQQLSDANAIYELSLKNAQTKITTLNNALDAEKIAKAKALSYLDSKIKELETANKNVDDLKIKLQATIDDNAKITEMKDSLISDLETLNLKHQERIAYLEEREVVLTRKVEVLADVVESYVDFNELTIEEQEQLISVMGDDGQWVMSMLKGNVASTEKMLFDLFIQKYKKALNLYSNAGLSEQLKNKINNLISSSETKNLLTNFSEPEKTEISNWVDSWTYQNELGETIAVDDKTKNNLKILLSSDSQAQILLIFEEQLKAVLEQKKAQLKLQQEAHITEVKNLEAKIQQTQKDMANAISEGETRLEEAKEKLLELEKEKNDKINNQQNLIEKFGSLLDLYSQRDLDLRQKESEARKLRASAKDQVESLNYYQQRYNNLSNKIAQLEDLIETRQISKTDVLEKLLDEQNRMDLNLYHSEYALPLALAYDENKNIIRSEFDVDIKYKTSVVNGEERQTFESIQEIISGQEEIGAKEEIILGLEDEMTGEYFYVDPKAVTSNGIAMLSKSNNFDDSLKLEVVNQSDFFVSFEYVKNDQRYRLSLVESTSQPIIPEQARAELVNNGADILNYDLKFVPIAQGQEATENDKFYVEGLALPVISQAVVIRANSNQNYMHGFLAIKEDENGQKYLGYSQFISFEYHSLFENYMQSFSVNRLNDQDSVRSILSNYIAQSENADKIAVIDSRTGFTEYDKLLQVALEKIIENNPYLIEARQEVNFYKLAHLVGTLNEFAQRRISYDQFTPRDSMQLKGFAQNYLEKFSYSLWQDSYAYKCLFGINDEEGNIVFEGLLNRGEISQLLSVKDGDFVRLKMNGLYILQNDSGELVFSGTLKVEPLSIFTAKISEQDPNSFDLLTYDGLRKLSLNDNQARLVNIAESTDGLKFEGTLKNPDIYSDQDKLVAVESASGFILSTNPVDNTPSGFQVDVIRKDSFESRVINLSGGTTIYPILEEQLNSDQSTINQSLETVLDYLRAYVTSANSYSWVDQVSQIIRLINQNYLEVADPKLVDQIEGAINLFNVSQDGEIFTIRRGTEYLCVQSTNSENTDAPQDFMVVFKNMPEGVDSSCLFKIYSDENNFESFAISGMHPNTKQYMYLRWNPANENVILGDVDTFAVTKRLPTNINEQFSISGVGIDLKLATILKESLSSKIVGEQNILTKVSDLTGTELSFERVKSHLVAFVNSPVADLPAQLYYAIADIFDNPDLSIELKASNCQKVVNDFYKMVVDSDSFTLKPFYSDLDKEITDSDSEQMSLHDACTYILEDFNFNSRRREGIEFTETTKQELSNLKLIASRNLNMSQLDQINLDKVLNPQDLSFELFYSTYQNDNSRLRIALLNLAKFVTGLSDLEFDDQNNLTIVGFADLYAREDFPMDYANEIIAQIANLVDTQILGNTITRIVEEEVNGEIVKKEIQEFTGNKQLVDFLNLIRAKLQNVLPVVQTVYSRDGMDLYDKLELAENMLNGKYRDEQGNVKFEINTSGALEILDNITDEEINEMSDPIGYQEWKKYLKGLSKAMEEAKKSLETFRLDQVQSRSTRN